MDSSTSRSHWVRLKTETTPNNSFMIGFSRRNLLEALIEKIMINRQIVLIKVTMSRLK